MQLLFVVGFVIAIATILGLGPSQRDAGRERSAALAVQMSAWHRWSYEACKAGCPSGKVTPGTYVPETIRGGGSYANGTFESRYDAPTRTLVTFAVPARLAGTEASSGTIAAAMRDARRVDSTSFGVWDAATRTVSPTYLAGRSATAVRTLPAPFAGATIPDGAAVIASRL